MNIELLAILLTSVLEVSAIVVLGILLGKQLRYIIRTQRALAGLVVQESEKVQSLLRDAG